MITPHHTHTSSTSVMLPRYLEVGVWGGGQNVVMSSLFLSDCSAVSIPPPLSANYCISNSASCPTGGGGRLISCSSTPPPPHPTHQQRFLTLTEFIF